MLPLEEERLLAATLKCTKIDVRRDYQDSPTPHKWTCYATDTIVPGVGNVSVSGQSANGTIESATLFQSAINGGFTLAGLPTVDWTK